jgi:N-acetylneuraminic acid mutarotase
LTQVAVGLQNGQIIVFGGDRTVAGSQSDSIYSVSPTTGNVKPIGTLPQGLAGAMAVSLPSEILLAGGVDQGGQTNATIYRVEIVNPRPKPKRRG